MIKEIKLCPEKEPNIDCKECYSEGCKILFFVNHKNKKVFEDFKYCTLCYPNSSYSFPVSCWYWKQIERIEAEKLRTEKGYSEVCL